MMEVNGVKSKHFMLPRSIRHSCLLSPILYILASEPILLKLTVNPFLHGITLSGPNTPASYSAYADDVTAFVKSNAEIVEGDHLVWGGDSSLYQLWTCGWVPGKESLYSDP